MSKMRSEQLLQNGHKDGKQLYICKQCRRQFVESYIRRAIAMKLNTTA